MEKKLKFPSIANVAAVLRAENPTLVDCDDEGCDVRLQVYPDGQWSIHVGDSSYDQDHRGFWGASSLPGAGKRFKSEDTARDLIDQARDHHAQSI